MKRVIKTKKIGSITPQELDDTWCIGCIFSNGEKANLIYLQESNWAWSVIGSNRQVRLHTYDDIQCALEDKSVAVGYATKNLSEFKQWLLVDGSDKQPSMQVVELVHDTISVDKVTKHFFVGAEQRQIKYELIRYTDDIWFWNQPGHNNIKRTVSNSLQGILEEAVEFSDAVYVTENYAEYRNWLLS